MASGASYSARGSSRGDHRDIRGIMQGSGFGQGGWTCSRSHTPRGTPPIVASDRLMTPFTPRGTAAGGEMIILRDGIPGTSIAPARWVDTPRARSAGGSSVGSVGSYSRGRAKALADAATLSHSQASAMDLDLRQPVVTEHSRGTTMNLPPATSRSARGKEEYVEPDWRYHEQEMKKIVAKDRAAFAFFRAPGTSFPSARLKELAADNQSQVTTPHQMSSTHLSHQFTPTQHPGDSGLWWGRRRDKVTEYSEVKLMQADIKFRK